MGSPWSDLDRPPLRVAALRSALTGPDGAWRAVEVVGETASTNADLRERAAAGEAEGLVLVAEHQSAGRGRLGRTWTAPARSALTVSVLLRPAVAADRLGWLPLLAGLAVTDALTRTCGLTVGLKWPNDVLVEPDGQKVCGILAEVAGGAVVLGAGINVSQTREELPVAGATSLRLAGSATADRDTVLRAYLRALAVRYAAFAAADGDPRGSGTGAPYRERCLTLGRAVAVHLPGGRTERGVAEEVDDDARLVVRLGSGRIERYAAGDVEHLRGDGP